MTRLPPWARALAAGGPLFKPFLNIAFAGTEPVTAMLSSAKFTFESAALAVMVAGLWKGLGPRASGRVRGAPASAAASVAHPALAPRRS